MSERQVESGKVSSRSGVEVGFNYRDTLLRMYDVVNRKLDSLDAVSARIKTWGITIWCLLTAQFLIRPSEGAALLWLAAVAVLTVWVIDLHYKFFHEQFLALSWRMEALLLREVVTDQELASVSFRNNITGRIVNQGRIHKAFSRCLGKYWFHLAYLVLLVFTVILCLIPHVKKV